MEVDPLTVTILRRQANDDDYVVSLESNNGYESDSWTLGNQLYMPFPFQVDDSLNSLTQSIQPCTNVAIVIEDFIGSSRVNCVYMAFNKNKSVLPDLSIIVNLSKCEKAPHSSFYEDEWFLDSDVSTHFTLFESDFVNMTLGNYG